MADIIFTAAGVITMAAIAITFIRIIMGPTYADRVVALDGMTTITILFIAMIAMFTNKIMYIDVAMIYSLIGFVGVVAVSRYMERGI